MRLVHHKVPWFPLLSVLLGKKLKRAADPYGVKSYILSPLRQGIFINYLEFSCIGVLLTIFI